MATFGNPSLSSHGQVEKPAPPVGVRADRDLGRLHQQKAQQTVTLLADVAQPSPIPAGFLRRHQPHIAGDLLAAAKALRRSDHQFKAVNGPTPGWVISRRATGRFSTSASRARVSSWIFVV